MLIQKASVSLTLFTLLLVQSYQQVPMEIELLARKILPQSPYVALWRPYCLAPFTAALAIINRGRLLIDLRDVSLGFQEKSGSNATF